MSVASPSRKAASDTAVQPAVRPARTLEDAFALHQSELLGTLFYLVGNLEDARDALQEAFLKCWKHQDQVDGVQNLKAWIFRIALNTGRDLRETAWRRMKQLWRGTSSGRTKLWNTTNGCTGCGWRWPSCATKRKKFFCSGRMAT
jgi:DNA-directed RNA polymerase specialized sigma24 family protein